MQENCVSESERTGETSIVLYNHCGSVLPDDKGVCETSLKVLMATLPSELVNEIIESSIGERYEDARNWNVIRAWSYFNKWWYGQIPVENYSNQRRGRIITREAIMLKVRGGRKYHQAIRNAIRYDIIVEWMNVWGSVGRPVDFRTLSYDFASVRSRDLFVAPHYRVMPKIEEIREIVTRVDKCRFVYCERMIACLPYRRALIVALKAEILGRVCSGRMVYAQRVSSVDDIVEDVVGAWLMILSPVFAFFEYCSAHASKIFEGGAQVVCSRRFISMCVCLLTIYLIYRIIRILMVPVKKVLNWSCSFIVWLWRGWKTTSSEIDSDSSNYFVSTDVTEKGLVYNVVVKGQQYHLSKREVSAIRQQEMALPGSLLCPSTNRPVGAIAVASNNSELSIIACYWRYEDYLVTAKHVANAISSGVSEVYLLGQKKNARGITIIDTGNAQRVERDIFFIENNKFHCDTLDVFAVDIGTHLWSKLKITKSSVRKPSLWGLDVNSVGWINDVLMTGNGKTVESPCKQELYHTASTQRGFSGSPLFSGGSVVGMHVEHTIDCNVAIRVETIKHFLPQPEWSTSPDEKEYEDEFRKEGETLSVKREHGALVGVNSRGAMRYLTEEELEEKGYDLTDKVNRSDLTSFKPKSGRNWADYSDDEDDYHYMSYRRKENACPKSSISSGSVSERSDVRQARRKRISSSPMKAVDKSIKMEKHRHGRRKENAPVPRSHYERVSDVTPVHTGKVPSVNEGVANWCKNNNEELVKLGFVDGEFAWPEINASTEKKSLHKHLNLFGERQKTVRKPPTVAERKRCVQLLAKMLEHNKYEPRVGYKSESNLKRIINSSLVDLKKSAGVPYQGQGMPTNGDVLKKLGEQGVIEKVLEKWDEPLYLKNFGKADPHKKRKLEKGMLRIITGFPVHKMIKNQALFREMLEVAVMNWQKSPIKYAFSPGKPGHVEHLVSQFNDRIGEADKTNWDFNAYKYFFEIFIDLIPELVVQPIDMSDEEFREYLKDAQGAVYEAAEGVYCCADGSAWKSFYEGIVKSGWLCTIDFNTICQIALHVLILMRMEKSDAEILGKLYAIIAGGDDTVQNIPEGFDTERYCQESGDLGVEMELNIRDNWEGVGYFSTELFDTKSGVIKYRPARFTKHIEKMKRCKDENLAMALSSAMINYCWDNKRFKIFDRLYREFRKERPQLFPLNLLKTQQCLQYHSKGYECNGTFDNFPVDQLYDLDAVLDSALDS